MHNIAACKQPFSAVTGGRLATAGIDSIRVLTLQIVGMMLPRASSNNTKECPLDSLGGGWWAAHRQLIDPAWRPAWLFLSQCCLPYLPHPFQKG